MCRCVLERGLVMKIAIVLTAAALCAFFLAAHADVPFIAAPEFYTDLAPWGTVAGDFNNDGHIDIAMTNYDFPGYATVVLGNGHGSFAFACSPMIDKTPYGIAAGDFDGDGNFDLVISSISNDPSDIVSVLLSRGDGLFEPAVKYPVGAFPESVAVADLNADGIPDIVTENTNSNSVSTLLGVGDGSLLPRTDFDLGLVPESLALGDIDGDGKIDVAVAANSPFAAFAVMLGNGDGTFGPPHYAGSSTTIFHGIALGDFNRDGRLDVAVLDGINARVDVYLALGGGLYSNVIEVPTDANTYFIAAADLFGDGNVELITSGGSVARLFETSGDGSFRDAGALPGIAGGAGIAVADINEDGKPDLVVPSYLSQHSTALLNQTLFRGGFE
jgi:hypothetical protein